MSTPQVAADVTDSWIGSIPVGQVVAFIVVVVGFGTVLLALWRKLKPLENFFADWNGEPARPGVAERPGVMPRLESIEVHIAESPGRVEFDKLVSSVDDIANQVKRNTAVVDLVRPYVVVDLPKGKLP